MAIKFSDTILSGSLKVSGSYTLPLVDTGSTGVLGQMGINGEVPHFYSSQGWQAVSGSKFTPIPPSGVNIEYLVVAGGGGAAKGGGGAGGYLSSSLSSITSGSTITVTVGAGGTGIVSDTSAGNTANQGGSSSLASSEFSTVAAIGGGGGAIAYYGVGGDGGSGGGGAGLDATGDGDGGSGTAGQGFDGGTGKYTTSHGGLYAMGGGGGASEVGSDAQNTTVNGSAKNGGDGGDGKQSKITGTLTYYAGGGGGGVHGDSTGYVTGDGGQGGGADAADQPGSNGQNAGNAGTANTGGGGGGAASLASYSGQTGGQGGSGVVILAYQTGSLNARGGGRRYFDDRVAHIFNSSGTFTMEGTKTLTHNTKDVFGDSSCLAFYQLDGNANEFGGTSGRLTGNAATFNGSSSILTMNQATVLGNIFGVTFWINIPSTPPDNDYIFWFGYGQNVGLYIDSSGVLQVYIGSYQANESYATTQTISTNTWYNVVLTCDSSTVTCYVNGVNKGTGGLSGGQNTTMTYQNVIGGYNSSTPSNHISMKMEDFRIYNRHITSTEASNLYNDTDISSTSLANRYIMKTDFTDSVGSRDLTNSNVTFTDLDGTATNVTFSQGYLHDAGTFNGSNAYIDLPTSLASSLRTAAAFSVSFWFKRDGNQTDTTYGGKLFQLLNDIYVNINLQPNNTVKANIVTSVPAYPETFTSVVPDGVWNHIVFTGDNNGIRLYLNNSLADSDSWDGTFMTYTNTNYKFNRIGYQGLGVSYFKGEIDHVRIFNRALTATEVTTLYNE